MGLSSSSPVEFSIHAQHSALSVGWLIVVFLCDSALSLHEISIYQCGRRSCQTQIKISHKMNKMMKPMPMAVIGKWTASADNFPIPQSPHTSTLTQTTINILVIAVVSAPPIQFYRTALPTLVRFLSLIHTHSLRKQKKKKILHSAYRLGRAMKTRIFSRALLAMYSTSMSMPFPFRYEKTFWRYAKARLRGAYFLFFFWRWRACRWCGLDLRCCSVTPLDKGSSTHRARFSCSLDALQVCGEWTRACLPAWWSER